MQEVLVFDLPHSLRLTEARQSLLREVLPVLKQCVTLQTALDAGCGVGYFASFLHGMAFSVTAFDARPGNVEEARRRFPHIEFKVADVQDPAVCQLGMFDLVLCFGLLYHLENPFAAIRNLHALTKKVLLVESMCVANPLPTLLFRDEGQGEDQSLRFVAFYPSESCLVKMLYRAGFSHVYRFTLLPDHEDFRATLWRRKVRTLLAATKVHIDVPFLAPVPEPVSTSDPWRTGWAKVATPAFRLWRFLLKPWSEKVRSVRFHFRRLWNHLFPSLPLPVRLPFGGWWLAWNDVCGDMVFNGKFEERERRFVEGFLVPGMTVLDIGAHHGFYTLLASFKVGSTGRVIAFEPSPRERKKLHWHLRLNRCKNVQVENSALGSYNGEAQLFLVSGRETGCNSLRKPNVNEPVHPVRVPVMRLDNYLQRHGIEQVDFVKMDVEGAELEVLEGAMQLLERRPRPVWMVEVQDIRTEPWGYRAVEIMHFLERFGYRWFIPSGDGSLVPVLTYEEHFDGNLIAVPEERLSQVQGLIKED